MRNWKNKLEKCCFPGADLRYRRRWRREYLAGMRKGLAKIEFEDRSILYKNESIDLTQYLDKSWQASTALTEKAIIKLSVNKKGELLIGTIGTVHYYAQATVKNSGKSRKTPIL